MKTKEKQELKVKPLPELEKMLQENRKKLHDMEFDLSAGKVKNVASMRELKKNIARIQTFIKAETAKSTK